MKDLLRLLRLFRPYRRWMLAGIALSTLVILSNVALLALAGWFITAMAFAGLGLGTIVYFTPAAGIRALAVIRTVGRYGERLVTHEATLRQLSRLRVWFYECLEPLAPARLQFHRGGDLLSRIQADIDTLDNFYLRVLTPVAAAVISTVLLIAFIATFSPLVALVNFAGLVLAGVVPPLIAQRMGRTPGRRVVALRSDLRATVAESVRGQDELYVYQALDRQAEQIDALSHELILPQRRQARIDGVTTAISGFASRLCMWLAIVVAIPLVVGGALTGPDLAMIAFFVLASFEAVTALPPAFLGLDETLAAARRIFAIADTPPAVHEPEAEPNIPPHRFDLRLRALRMRYEDNNWALNGVDLHVPGGSRIAIVGPTGSGKTSLINVLLRFRAYQEGTFTIDDMALETWSGESIRGWCAVVSQHTHLFNATVRENLLLARPNADEEALLQALRQAHLFEEVMALPRGLDTEVGEVGMRLSGGQARRLSIARALLKDAPMLVLDEPTEGLDAHNEQAVLQALESLMQGRTTLLVTHRPQALRYVDRVAVMRNGRIVEDGAPGALLEQGSYLTHYLHW